MKGLKIRGKIHSFEMEYEVLFSQLVKDFTKLPNGTQIKMIEVLICNTAGNDISKFEKLSLISSLKTTLAMLEETI